MKEWELADKIGLTALLVLVMTVFTIGLVAIGANGEIDYCWVNARSRDTPSIHYYLIAHRAWRDDAQMGVFDTFDDAVAAAGKAQCPLHK